MNERNMHLVDDLMTEFRDGDDGWFNIGPETQKALREMWELCDELKPDYQPCECGFRDVVCPECGSPRKGWGDD